MKKLKYMSIMALLFSTLTIGCSEEILRPGDGDDEENDPIIIDPPPTVTDTVAIDSING